MGETAKGMKKAILNRVTYFLTGKTFEGSPFRGYLGLRAYYQTYAWHPHHGYRRGIITNELLEFAGVTEEELDQAARRNTPVARDYQIATLGSAMKELADEMDADLGESLEGAIIAEKEIPFGVYVVTSRDRIEGADVLLFPKIFERVAEKLHSDVYIWTSSTNEAMVASKNRLSAEDIHNIVRDINRDVVDDEEVLPDAVYEYIRGSGEVTVARAASGRE